MGEHFSSSPELKQVLDAALSTMQAEQYCFLITVDTTGQPQARMVAAASIGPDMSVWITTSRESRKVREIRKDNRATMAFSDNKGEGYVTLIGHARLDNDVNRKKALWKLQYEAFFPGGAEGNDSILIEFTPNQIEVMHFHLKVGIWPWTFEPTILVQENGSWKRTG